MISKKELVRINKNSDLNLYQQAKNKLQTYLNNLI